MPQPKARVKGNMMLDRLLPLSAMRAKKRVLERLE
jgi:hypothetical protein